MAILLFLGCTQLALPTSLRPLPPTPPITLARLLNTPHTPSSPPPFICREYVSALYDWHNTSAAAGLRVTVWVNDTNVGGGQATGQGPPDVQRWSQAVNLAGGSSLPTLQCQAMPRGCSKPALPALLLCPRCAGLARA